jgi:hypothetical protein
MFFFPGTPYWKALKVGNYMAYRVGGLRCVNGSLGGSSENRVLTSYFYGNPTNQELRGLLAVSGEAVLDRQHCFRPA